MRTTGAKLPCSYELEYTLTHVRYHLHRKRKKIRVFLFFVRYKMVSDVFQSVGNCGARRLAKNSNQKRKLSVSHMIERDEL